MPGILRNLANLWNSWFPVISSVSYNAEADWKSWISRFFLKLSRITQRGNHLGCFRILRILGRLGILGMLGILGRLGVVGILGRLGILGMLGTVG